MITNFKIENYKSINKLTIDLGRVNVFIGENGCGKSNIIEAIALASAATEDKLDNEFLTARGVRVTTPKLMRSAYDIEKITTSVRLGFMIDNESNFEYELVNDNMPYSKWEAKLLDSSDVNVKKMMEIEARIANISNKMTEIEARIADTSNKMIEIELRIADFLTNTSNLLQLDNSLNTLKFKYLKLTNRQFENFLIYSPENTSLRVFEKEGQIEPLGVNGEGLFKLLKYFSTQTESGYLEEIKRYLKVFDWFKDFSVPEKLFEGESYLQIQDRFIENSIELDQRSSNEGFLFVLFGSIQKSVSLVKK